MNTCLNNILEEDILNVLSGILYILAVLMLIVFIGFLITFFVGLIGKYNITKKIGLIGFCIAGGSAIILGLGGYGAESIWVHQIVQSIPGSHSSTSSSDEPKTTGEKSAAVASANEYVNSLHLSKSKIYEQLVNEGKFPKSKAQYAVDHINPDWNKVALANAQSYISDMPMSKFGLEKQLGDYEGFTISQAKYAVNHVKVDWNQQALKRAKSYQKNVHLSNEEILDQLVSYEEFTQSQAQYAVNHLK